jgi:hypothetical protein
MTAFGAAPRTTKGHTLRSLTMGIMPCLAARITPRKKPDHSKADIKAARGLQEPGQSTRQM